MRFAYNPLRRLPNGDFCKFLTDMGKSRKGGAASERGAIARLCQNQDFQDWRDFQDFAFAQRALFVITVNPAKTKSR